jgi:hypothetical protein
MPDIPYEPRATVRLKSNTPQTRPMKERGHDHASLQTARRKSPLRRRK